MQTYKMFVFSCVCASELKAIKIEIRTLNVIHKKQQGESFASSSMNQSPSVWEVNGFLTKTISIVKKKIVINM